MALNQFYGFEYSGHSGELTADGAPNGTVYIFDNRQERDAWVNFPSRRPDGSCPVRDTLKSRAAAALLRRRLPVVDFSADANILDPYN